MPMSRFAPLLAGLAALLAGTAVAIPAHVAAQGDRARILDRDFESIAVVQNERDHPLFRGVEVEADLGRRGRIDFVGWYAGCNFHGGRGRITRTRLLIHSISSTAIGCAPAASHRDRWLTAFFASDPRWRLTDSGILKLSSASRRIRLVEPPRPAS